MKCRKCGTKFKHVIGYGPICPNEMLRLEMLRKYPPVCPKCGSKNCGRLDLMGILWGLLERVGVKWKLD